MSNPERGEQATGPNTYASDSGISVQDEDAMKVSAVWACTQIITDSVSSLPLKWYREKNGERLDLDQFDPLSRLWRNRPNKWMKWRDFRRSLTFQLALWNNAYAKVDRDSSGNVIALTPLHPARMTVYRTDAGVSYHYHGDLGVSVFAQDSVLHLKGLTTEGIVGLNRSDFARNSYGVAVSSDKYAAKQFANGGRPAGVLKLDKLLTKEQRAEVAKIYEGITSTADNAGKLWVLEGGMSYEKIAIDPSTMQMIESRMHQVGDIARFFGVPGVLIGAGNNQSSSWPASFEQQQLSFLTYTLSSYLDEWECALMDSIVPDSQRGKVVCDHDEDDFIKMDSKAKTEMLSTLGNSGFVSRNEGRRKLGLRKSGDKNADKLTVQTAMAPLETVGEQDADENTIN
ncbi:MAG: phage portal protein [Rickettsiales bacterium]